MKLVFISTKKGITYRKNVWGGLIMSCPFVDRHCGGNYCNVTHDSIVYEVYCDYCNSYYLYKECPNYKKTMEN